jgi:hypothetical protein
MTCALPFMGADMSGAGIVLVGIGILAAVLSLYAPHLLPWPLSAVGGIGTVVAGILLFGIGFALLLMGQRRRRLRRMQAAQASGAGATRAR